MSAKQAGTAEMILLLEDLNSSLGFHIPATKAQHLAALVSQGPKALIEAILYIEGLDREDDARKFLQRKIGDFLMAELRRRTTVDKIRKTLTLARPKASGP